MLTGKRILVTGASRGIGAAIARVCHGYGADVVIHYGRSHDAARQLVTELGERATAISFDLFSADAPRDLWDKAAAGGRVDVLINNAGAWIESPLETEASWDSSWQANYQLNLKAPADLCRLAINDFRSTGGGIIINITSRSAHRGDDADHLAYGAVKGGLLALTRGIARGYARDGILAYAVSPGWVNTDIAAGQDLEELARALPLGEVTPPEDVAEVVAFLASGKSRHSTGTTIDITGADYVR